MNGPMESACFNTVNFGAAKREGSSRWCHPDPVCADANSLNLRLMVYRQWSFRLTNKTELPSFFEFAAIARMRNTNSTPTISNGKFEFLIFLMRAT